MIPNIPVSPAKSKKERQLLKLFAGLDAENQQHVLSYVEFLASKIQSGDNLSEEPVPEVPVIEPRPQNETVIAAIKRLSRSYSMLNKDDMLHETSDLMSSHVLKGRSAEEVIDDLEILFLKHYEKRKLIDDKD